MKYLYLALLFTVVIISGCCTKKKCINAFDYDEISLEGFLVSEVDSIVISSYREGSNFSTLIQSGYTNAIESSNDTTYLIIYMPIDLNPNSEYLLEFTAIGKTYRISNIEEEMTKCNSCVIGRDLQPNLKSYCINGSTVTTNSFTIRK